MDFADTAFFAFAWLVFAGAFLLEDAVLGLVSTAFADLAFFAGVFRVEAFEVAAGFSAFAASALLALRTGAFFVAEAFLVAAVFAVVVFDGDAFSAVFDLADVVLGFRAVDPLEGVFMDFFLSAVSDKAFSIGNPGLSKKTRLHYPATY